MVADRRGDGSPRTPFPAIVGQDDLKRVLLAVAANDDLDGALITGEKGTAKSTAVRALVDLLPEQRAVADCPYGCPPGDPAAQCEECRERRSEDEALPVETRPVPLVTLPLGATRDRVVGTLSVADALDGEAEFDSGLLARANRGFLYVDEVNLLDDHLVDVLLDAAAGGVNTVERDGVSVSHPADVTLIGTMNPEEGDLRPQLRDRFALQATVAGSDDVEERVEILDRALARSLDGEGFAADYADEVDRLRETLATARDRVDEVALPREWKAEIAELCRDAGVDGHRGDIATARTAMTLAALDGRRKVIEPDVREAASYALPHRLRSRPFEDAPDPEELLEDRFDDAEAGDADGGTAGSESDGDRGGDEIDAGTGHDSSDDADGSDGGPSGPEPGDAGAEDGSSGGRGGETDATDDADPGSADDGPADGGSGPGVGSRDPGKGAGPEPADGPRADDGGGGGQGSDDPGDGSADDPESGGDETDEATPLVPGQRRDAVGADVSGVGTAAAPHLDDPDPIDVTGADEGDGRVRSTAVGDRGARVRTERADPDDAIDAAASVRAAATRGGRRVEREDLRRSVRATASAATIVFAVDASASMRPAMRAAKGVVLDLLEESYQHRDEVAFVAFAGEDAEVLLPPTDSVTLAARHLKELPTGDRTPLPAGLETAGDVLAREDPDAAVVVLVTDGRANVADGSPTAATRRAARRLATTGARVLVVDAGDGGRATLSDLVAGETGGEVVDLDALTPERVREAAASVADPGA